MKSYKLNNILLIICCALIVSCVRSPVKNSFEIFDEINLSKKQIISEINLRERKIADLKSNIQILSNYNVLFKSQIDFESSYNKDISSISRAYFKNNEIITKNEIQIAKLNSEIRVLNRKKDLN